MFGADFDFVFFCADFADFDFATGFPLFFKSIGKLLFSPKLFSQKGYKFKGPLCHAALQKNRVSLHKKFSKNDF